jgi:pSer/pThr/pTyr-binding forkhead associated (FHA) protein
MPKLKNAFLIVEKGAPFYRREVFVISENRFTIGRETEYSHPDLSFTSSYISRKHAEIERRNDSYYLSDHSKHGTKVNGICIDKLHSYQLKQDDRIELAGNEATIQFSLKIPAGETLPKPKQEEIEILLDDQKREVFIRGELINYPVICILYSSYFTKVGDW